MVLDPLSKDLLDAGEAFITFFATNYRKSAEEPGDDFLKAYIEKIEKIGKVLLNPYGSGMLHDPWIIQNALTLDKSNVDEYIQYALEFNEDNLSFNKENIQAVPHLFAKEVIDWLNNLPSYARNEVR